jgi:hypothetical protein
VPEKLSFAAADTSNLYVVTYNDPAKIIKYKLGTMERLATLQFTREQNFTLATQACVDVQEKYLYVYGFKYSGGEPVLARMLIQDNAFQLDSISSVPAINNLKGMFADDKYIYYISQTSVSRATIDNLATLETIIGGTLLINIGNDPTDSKYKIAYYTKYSSTVNRVQLKTFQILSPVSTAQLFVGDFSYSSSYRDQSQSYITRTDLRTQTSIDFPVGPLQTKLSQPTYQVSFVADSITNKVYALYQRKYVMTPSMAPSTIWSDATIYTIDDSTNTATSTGVIALGTDVDLPDKKQIIKFFWIINGNAYYGSNNKLYRYSLTDLGSKNEIELPRGTSDGCTLLARKQHLYFTSKNDLSRFNYATGEIESIIDYPYGIQDPSATYVDKDEKYAYLSVGYNVAKIDLQTKTVVVQDPNRRIEFKLFGGLTLGKKECLLLEGGSNNNLVVWDTSYQGAVFGAVFSIGYSNIFGYTVVGEAIYFASKISDHYIQISTWSDYKVQALFTVTTNQTKSIECIKIIAQGNSLYLSTEQSLYVYDLTTFAGQAIIVDNTPTTNTVFSCSSPMLFPGGSYMYWSNIMTGRLYKIDIASRTPVEWIEDPRALAFTAVVAPNARIYFGGSTSNYGVIETGETNNLFDDPAIETNATRIPSTTTDNTRTSTSSSVVPHLLILALMILMVL